MTFVCWLFKGEGFDRGKVMTYSVKHVKILAAMLHRHGGHRLVCITDQGPIPGIYTIPMPEAVARLPRYYPKLWAFSRDFGHRIGEAFVSIDLDVVVVDDLLPAIPAADFIIWDQARGEPYNSSLFRLAPGARADVWETFSPDKAAAAQRTCRHRWTGDQSWIAHVLGADQPTFGQENGILQYRPSLHRRSCPSPARALFTCGPYRPDLEAEVSPWIAEAYR